MLMLTVQAQTFYGELGAVVQQLTKMENQLATTGQVGLLPETLRVQQRQFMVWHVVFAFTNSPGNWRIEPIKLSKLTHLNDQTNPLIQCACKRVVMPEQLSYIY